MKIVGLNGRLRSGKDTAYDFIQENFGRAWKIERAGFADKLKFSAARALGYDPQTVEEAVGICNTIKERGHIKIEVEDFPSISISGREFQQRYGTEAHRDIFGEDFWVDALLPKPTEFGASWATSDVDILFVTDVRYENEAQRILDLKGEIWWIDANARLGALPSNAHASELGLPSKLITRTVDNNTTLEKFHSNLQTAFWETVT